MTSMEPHELVDVDDETARASRAIANATESSPLARLTPELQSMVFVEALPCISCAHQVQQLSLRQAPLNVSHVCRSWRIIALSTPRLWTRISFNHPANMNYSRALAIASSIPVFLKRSASCVLYIKLDTCAFYNLRHRTPSKHYADALAQLMRLWGMVVRPVVSCRQRWKEVLIECRWGDWFCGYATSGKMVLNNLYSLRNLQFRILEAIPVDTKTQLKLELDLSEAAKIENLILTDNADFIQLCSVSRVSLPKLRGFAAQGKNDSFSLDAIYKILATSPSLEDFCLWLPTRGSTETQEDAIIPLSLANLHRLRLLVEVEASDDTVRQFTDILQRIVTPSLRDLDISFSTCWHSALSHAACLLCLSGGPLRNLHLTVDNGEVDMDGLISCLEASPMLRTLSIEIQDFSLAELARRLTVHAHPTYPYARATLCPRLQQLDLVVDDIGVSAHALAELLLSRSPPEGEKYPTHEDRKSGIDLDGLGMARNGTSVLFSLTVHGWLDDDDEEDHGSEESGDSRNEESEEDNDPHGSGGAHEAGDLSGSGIEELEGGEGQGIDHDVELNETPHPEEILGRMEIIAGLCARGLVVQESYSN